jgi:hypothetical protein
LSQGFTATSAETTGRAHQGAARDWTRLTSATGKTDRRARLATSEKGLAKREGATDERGTKNTKAAIDKLRIALETAEKIVQAETDWTFDAADFLKDLRALNRKIK